MSAPASRHTTAALVLWRRIFDGERGYLYVFSGVRPAPGVKTLLDVHKAMYPYPQSIGNAEQWLIEESNEGREVYAGAALFVDPKRGGNRENAARVRAAWVDGDGATVPPHLPASTITVESSPGRTQEYWLLSRAIEPEAGEAINHRLVYAIGADTSGWDINQLLRVPGFPNRKYPDPPIVTIIRDDGPIYDPDELLAALPEAPARTARTSSPADVDGEGDEPPVRLEGDALRVWRGELVSYRKDEPGVIDRSATLYRLGCILEEHGMTASGIAAGLRNRDSRLGWNCYTGRPAYYTITARKAVNREREPIAYLRPKRAAAGDAEQVAILQGRLLHIAARIRQNGALKHEANTGIALAVEAVSAEERGRLQPDGSFVAWIGDVIAPMTGVSRQSVSNHLKRFEAWGLLTLGYCFARQPIIDTDTGEIVGEREVVRGRTVKLSGGVFTFLEALATFVPPKDPGRPHQHCHPDLSRCHRPCCRDSDVNPAGDSEPDVKRVNTKDLGDMDDARVETLMSNTFTSGSKEPRDGFTSCALCQVVSRYPVCGDCAVRLGGQSFWRTIYGRKA
ncbi:MAG: DNA-primase RepB domain-containing protein [Dehalococcoidia bacterium]